jgi:hypothetical protein
MTKMKGLRVFDLDEWEALRDARVAESPAVQAHYSVLASKPAGSFRTRPRSASKQALLDAMAEMKAKRG